MAGLTSHGLQLVFQFYYKKGGNFIAAAVLLDQQKNRDGYVVLQLLCQGIEIVVKALLFHRNTTKYQPKFMSKKYGHRLMPLIADALQEFHLKPLQPRLKAELEELSRMYQTNIFRYDLLTPILIGADSVNTKRVFRRTVAMIRLTERELRKVTQSASTGGPSVMS